MNMELLNEHGPVKYKPYVKVLEDELVMQETENSELAKSIEEINKERKFSQVFF